MADGAEAAAAFTIGWEPQPTQAALLACPGQDVALAERSATAVRLSRTRRRRGRLPGAQLHARLCRGVGHVPERLACSAADGDVALWRRCPLRFPSNGEPGRARAPVGKGALHRSQSSRMGEIRKFTYENPWTGETIEQDRVFIPSKLQDNKFLGPEYVANLQMVGSDTLVRAWLGGDWTVIDGAYFDCWRYDLHVVQPFEIPAEWSRFRSMDWGSAKPFSVGWWAVVGDDYAPRGGRFLPRGALVRYREWYGAASPNVGLKLTAEDVAAGIVQRESRDLNLRYGVLDPACFKEDGGPSIAERINKELIAARLRPFHAADNARVPLRGSIGGWDQLRSRLVGQDGRPMIYCFSNHADSIRTIPALQHDPARQEDVNTESEDHAADEWRYACMSRPFVRVPAARTRSVPDVGYTPIRSAVPDDWKVYRGIYSAPQLWRGRRTELSSTPNCCPGPLIRRNSASCYPWCYPRRVVGQAFMRKMPGFIGAPGTIRTSDPQIRSLALIIKLNNPGSGRKRTADRIEVPWQKMPSPVGRRTCCCSSWINSSTSTTAGTSIAMPSCSNTRPRRYKICVIGSSPRTSTLTKSASQTPWLISSPTIGAW
jgi:hypothetical protein